MNSHLHPVFQRILAPLEPKCSECGLSLDVTEKDICLLCERARDEHDREAGGSWTDHFAVRP
jgi:hypothetical protein